MDLLPNKLGFVGPTFSVKNRAKRIFWIIVWGSFCSWTPAPLHKWRIFWLRIFGAKVSWKSYVYGTVKVWAPWNLSMAEYATLAPNVVVYNIATVELGFKSVVSQGAHLCTGSHDYRDPLFPLFSKRILIGNRSWVCAGAFVGPGVIVGDGAVLAAYAVTFKDLMPWTVYIGNTAHIHGQRPVIHDH